MIAIVSGLLISIANNFAANFITTKLKKHKENVLFDKERALLPSTQPIVENMIQAKKIDDIIADELYPQLREINRKIRNLD